ncbi:hypothetical protein GCM10023225_06970 [Kineococcus glutinatus]|uniref:GGDEF domain-containing protein n=1 Tax=Kineococcus glutinatus TaxID=1070872 RepID=A0ABP9HBV8_9ACTN
MPWLLGLLCLLPVLVVHVGMPLGSTPQVAAYYALMVAALTAVVAGVRRSPAARRRSWALVAASQVLFLVADLGFIVRYLCGGGDRFPVVDVPFLVGYGLLALGVMGLVRPADSHRRGALLDASIVTVSCAALLGVRLVVPLLANDAAPLPDRVVAALYPLADVGVVYLLARTALLTGQRSRSSWLLLAALALLVAADVGFCLGQLAGAQLPAQWVTTGWLCSRALIALAVWSSPVVAPPAPARAQRPVGLTRTRLLVLALAAALPSGLTAALGLRGGDTHPVLLGCAALVLVVLVAVRMGDLLAQVHEQAAQLAVQARTDALTGLANRRTWDHEVARACATARRGGTGLAVALLDLDHFKQFNDAHGHAVGDELLREAAVAWTAALHREVGPDAVLARWGGEEFAVLLPGVDAAAAAARLSALHRGVPRGQTCSIGVAAWDPAEEPAAALRRADEALYTAKRSGRARTVVAGVPPAGVPGHAGAPEPAAR